MQDDNLIPDRPAYVTTLKACTMLAQESKASCEYGEPVRLIGLDIGRMLHSIIYMNIFAHNIYVDCSLITLYGKCGALLEAENIFISLLCQDVVSCSALLSAYVEQGLREKALWLYRQMLEEGLSSDKCTDILALQACGIISQSEDLKGEEVALEVGQALHAKARKEGFEADADFHSLLVSLYGKCGAVTKAFHAFCVLSHCDVATWNALLCANITCGTIITALHLYAHMQKIGVIPNQQSCLFALQACAALYADLEEVEEQ
ncbi:hypothetical protein L7F22_059220 [Adiantum nelumboides]|nr:hypothetical protein [Adiantum nelumboides]